VAVQSRTMKLSVALFFAGLFGALAAVFILLSFGTDYWLLAAESCHPNPDGSVSSDIVTAKVGVNEHFEMKYTLCVHSLQIFMFVTAGAKERRVLRWQIFSVIRLV